MACLSGPGLAVLFLGLHRWVGQGGEGGALLKDSWAPAGMEMSQRQVREGSGRMFGPWAQ